MEHQGSSFSTPTPTLAITRLFIVAIWVGVRWCLMVLICSPLITSDAEHLFLCLLTIWISSLEKCLFRSFVHFSVGLFVFLLLSCERLLKYILDTMSLSKITGKFFLSFCGFSYPFLDRLRSRDTNILILMVSSLSMFSFALCAFGIMPKTLPNLGS